MMHPHEMTWNKCIEMNFVDMLMFCLNWMQTSAWSSALIQWEEFELKFDVCIALWKVRYVIMRIWIGIKCTHNRCLLPVVKTAKWLELKSSNLPVLSPPSDLPTARFARIHNQWRSTGCGLRGRRLSKIRGPWDGILSAVAVLHLVAGRVQSTTRVR
jgi:hypothetical protein